MAVSRKAMTEGIRTILFWQSLSLALAGDVRASSLYTREPGCSRTSAFFRAARKVSEEIFGKTPPARALVGQ